MSLLVKSYRKCTKSPAFWAVLIALIFAAVIFFITIYLLYDSFHTGGFDLGVFTQDLKSTLQGQILYSSAGQYQLAHHFSPVLLLLVPFYWFFPHPQMLLVVQGLLLAFSGFLIYRVALEYKFSPRAGLILEGLFFINPLVWGVALYDFHEVAFAIPALLVMFLGMKKRTGFSSASASLSPSSLRKMSLSPSVSLVLCSWSPISGGIAKSKKYR